MKNVLNLTRRKERLARKIRNEISGNTEKSMQHLLSVRENLKSNEFIKILL